MSTTQSLYLHEIEKIEEEKKTLQANQQCNFTRNELNMEHLTPIAFFSTSIHVDIMYTYIHCPCIESVLIVNKDIDENRSAKNVEMS